MFLEMFAVIAPVHTQGAKEPSLVQSQVVFLYMGPYPAFDFNKWFLLKQHTPVRKGSFPSRGECKYQLAIHLKLNGEFLVSL